MGSKGSRERKREREKMRGKGLMLEFCISNLAFCMGPPRFNTE